MAKKTRAGTAWKQGYAGYKAADRYTKNRKRAIAQHLRDNPSDAVAQKALSAVEKGKKWTRKKPTAKGGWVSGKVMFGMMEYVGKDNNPNVPLPMRSGLGFIGQRSRATQVKLAQYMKLSRKTANEMAHASKADREHYQRMQMAADRAKTNSAKAQKVNQKRKGKK